LRSGLRAGLGAEGRAAEAFGGRRRGQFSDRPVARIAANASLTRGSDGTAIHGIVGRNVENGIYPLAGAAHMKKFAVVMSTCLFVPGLAVAQAEPGEAGARACADIQAADERLACYDSAFNRPPNPPPVMATPADVFANASMAPVNRCDKGPPTSLLDSRWELETYTFDE